MKPEEIIDQLILDGKITQEDLTAARMENQKRRAIDTIHTAVCRKNHNNGECPWYEEEKLPYPWLELHHATWLELFNILIASAEAIKLVPESVTEESSGATDD